MKKITMKFRLVVLLSLFLGTGAIAKTVTTAGSGNWNSTVANAPWPGGSVPGTYDNVVIALGHSVAVTASESQYNSVTVNGALTINNGVTLSINYTSLTVNGSLTINSGAAMTFSSSSITLNGDMVNNGTFSIG